MDNPRSTWWQANGQLVQLVAVLLLQAGTLVYFARGLSDGQVQLHEALGELKVQVHEMSSAVDSLAKTAERSDEHMKAVDRRLDRLEVGKWERQP